MVKRIVRRTKEDCAISAVAMVMGKPYSYGRMLNQKDRDVQVPACPPAPGRESTAPDAATIPTITAISTSQGRDEHEGSGDLMQCTTGHFPIARAPSSDMPRSAPRRREAAWATGGRGSGPIGVHGGTDSCPRSRQPR